MLELVSLVAILLGTAPTSPVPYSSFQISDAEFERVVSPDYKACLASSGGVTVQMRDCSAAEFGRLDAKLNAEYRSAMSRLQQNVRLKLRQFERDWLKVRWRECDRKMAEEDGGTLALVISDGCRLSEIARRTVWLRRYGR